MDNTFRENLGWFEELDSQSRPFSIYQPTKINQKTIMMSLWLFTFLKLSDGENQTLERSWTKNQQQCCIQLYFGTFWAVWVPEKIYKYIFHVKTKLNIACKYLTKIFSRDTNILPQMYWTLNIFGPSTTTIRGFCVSLR